MNNDFIIEQIKNKLRHIKPYQLPNLFIKYQSANVSGGEALFDTERYISKQLKKLSNKELQSLLLDVSSIDSDDTVIDNMELGNDLVRFKEDHPGTVAFIIMEFEDSQDHSDIVDAIKKICSSHGIEACRADDKEYSAELFKNIKVYMEGSDFGISVFERINSDKFNPNISLEVGYMLGLDKKVCYLKDKTMESLHSDLIGHLYKNFSTRDIYNTIKPQLEKWLSDNELI